MKVTRTNCLTANHSVDQLFNLCKRIDGDSSTNVERWNFATRSHGATIKSLRRITNWYHVTAVQTNGRQRVAKRRHRNTLPAAVESPLERTPISKINVAIIVDIKTPTLFGIRWRVYRAFWSRDALVETRQILQIDVPIAITIDGQGGWDGNSKPSRGLKRRTEPYLN